MLKILAIIALVIVIVAAVAAIAYIAWAYKILLAVGATGPGFREEMKKISKIARSAVRDPKIQIKYIDGAQPLEKIEVGDWIDLRARETVELKAGEFALIPLGVAMKLPEGFEAHVVPRSSTFMKYHILQTNSLGVIDNSYSGDADEWKMPVIATEDTVIPAGDRICQFRITASQPCISFEEVDTLGEESRGAFGSTGEK